MRLEELLSRVESANGPDRQLDIDVNFVVRGLDARPYAFVEQFTGSIDAARALTREKFPDREWAVGDDRENRRCWATIADDVWDEAMDVFRGFAATEPLAIIAALLKTLVAEKATASRAAAQAPTAPGASAGHQPDGAQTAE